MSATRESWQFLIDTVIEELQKNRYKNQSTEEIREKLQAWSMTDLDDFIRHTFK